MVRSWISCAEAREIGRIEPANRAAANTRRETALIGSSPGDDLVSPTRSTTESRRRAKVASVGRRGVHITACNISQHVFECMMRRWYLAWALGSWKARMGGRVRRSAKAAADEAPTAVTPRRGRMSLVDLAYERIEELIIHCELKPGQFLAIQDLL